MDGKKKTQRQVVVERLLSHGSVDNFWAIGNYMLRLGAIICELRKDGWEFDGKFGDGREQKNFYYHLVKQGR